MFKARCFIYLDPSDCIAPHGLDLNWKHDKDKVDYLTEQF